MLNKFLRLVFYWPIRLTTNCRPIPPRPLENVKLDKNKPIVYVTVSSSLGNLLAIERLTEKLGLPSPFEDLVIGGTTVKRVAFLRRASFFGHFATKVGLNKIYNEWMQACYEYNTDIQIIPITVLWSRNPSYEGLNLTGIDTPTPSCKKFLTLTFAGRDNCTIVSEPVSALDLQKKMLGRSKDLINRTMARHFLKQARSVVGKPMPNRKRLLKALVKRPGSQAAIEEELKKGELTREQLEAKAYSIFSNMAADTRYPLLRFLNSIITFLWRRFYHGQTIIGAERVREMVRNGYEIIYIPCHRSHMDYILLSFVIFREGLPIPQIASGDNLNFFPVGPFIRRCGSYFIRRKIKGDTFYSSLFREYMAMLFESGYATEFFIEGGRSRTGRTLPPKTGMVAMTVQAQLRGIERPIAFVPTYLGYEHVMEVGSYMKELGGAKKKKESAMQLLGIFKRLRYYGRGYVSFGEPVVVPRFLSSHVPNWRDDVDPMGNSRPEWLFDTVNQMAHEIIMSLNDSAMVNGINLCAMALISDEDHTMSMKTLNNCIRLYLDLLACDKNRADSIPKDQPHTLIQQALELRKFHTYDVGENVIFVRPSKGQTLQLTYFQNNILHLFALPALVASILICHKTISQEDIIGHTRSLFYFLRHELFAPVTEEELDELIMAYVDCFIEKGYVIERGGKYTVSGEGFEEFHILALSINLNLTRYLVAAIALDQTEDNVYDQEQFIEHCVNLSNELPAEITHDSPEFADPILFRIMCFTFVRHSYFTLKDKKIVVNHPKVHKLLDAAQPLLHEKDVTILKENDLETRSRAAS